MDSRSLTEHLGSFISCEWFLQIPRMQSLDLPYGRGERKEMNNEIRTTVEIADASGHSALELTKAETMEVVNQNQGAWVFAGNRLVKPAELEQADWGTVGTVRLMPPLVGGLN